MLADSVWRAWIRLTQQLRNCLSLLYWLLICLESCAWLLDCWSRSVSQPLHLADFSFAPLVTRSQIVWACPPSESCWTMMQTKQELEYISSMLLTSALVVWSLSSFEFQQTIHGRKLILEFGTQNIIQGNVVYRLPIFLPSFKIPGNQAPRLPRTQFEIHCLS